MSTNVVFGTWSAASTNDNNVDLEAQVVVGRYESSPSTVPYVYGPPPARTYSPRAQSAASQGTDPVDDFFGVTCSTSRGTQDSRHDDRRVSIHLDEEIAPPPYAYSNDLPSYASVAEPPTLAMYLFKFGFLFPLFWLAGIIVLLCPLQAPEGWEPSKTQVEREELLVLMRRTEVKWAKRCLIAFSVFALVVLAITLTAVFALRS